MKYSAFLITVLLGLISCSGKSSKEKGTSPVTDSIIAKDSGPEFKTTADIYKHTAVPKQHFTISNNSDTTLTGDRGTSVKISKGSFDVPDGKTVEVDLKECYDLGSFLAENLSTESEGKLLESGGMICIEASSEGKNVNLKEGKTIDIGFAGKPAKDMRLFNGERDAKGNIDWKPGTAKPKEFVPKRYKKMVGITSAEIVGYNSKTKYQPIHFKKDKTIKLDEYMEKNFNVTAAEYVSIPYSASVFFSIDKSGKLHYVRSDEHLNEAAKKKISNFFEKLPELEPFTKKEQPVETQVFYIVRKSEGIDVEELEREIKKGNAAISSQLVEKVLFTSTSLGWINCDKFSDDPSPKIDMIVDAATIDADVKLVFPEIKSVMRGTAGNGGLMFNRVPAGKKARLFAMKYSEGKCYMASREITISKEPLKLEFAQVSYDVLKKEMEKLN